MRLREILKNIEIRDFEGDDSRSINSVHFDSRKVQQGDLFVALRGTQTDGHKFIDKAIEQGASAVIAEEFSGKSAHSPIVRIRVKNSAEALGDVASNFFQQPSTQLKLVGVTGTNGKTTTTTLLYELYTRLGYKTGLISTIENKIGTSVRPATHTTPDPLALNRLLAEMAEAGCDYVFMEVSSHAIQQRRIAGLRFTGAVFTNITHDHLDYHGTFQNYIYAKKMFFDALPKDAFALTNTDDKRGLVMVQNTNATVKHYALKRPADFKARIIENTLHGLYLQIEGTEFHSRLIGTFNAYNLLAVYAVAALLGSEKMEILTALSDVKSAEGRFEYLIRKKDNVTGIIDYAHTPDALEKVLTTIEDLKNKNARNLTVIGCGGNRDKDKRPVMAHIACRLSDFVILTSDNPRFEEPEAILMDMQAGVPEEKKAAVLTISNRAEAIKTAAMLARPGDIILVAGKGHEKYQEIKGEKHPFDDMEKLKKALGL